MPTLTCLPILRRALSRPRAARPSRAPSRSKVRRALGLAVTLYLLLPCGLDVSGVPATADTAEPGVATASSWDQRGETVLTSQDALAALTTLPADAPAPVSWGAGGGREGWFGPAWQDVDGDGCDTRNEILARDLDQPDFSRLPGRQDAAGGAGRGVESCPDRTVYSGRLTDPYTGSAVEFQRGQGTSEAVQIDHVVPLNYLYAHGAWLWQPRTRALAANDPLNLLAVDGRANQAKSNCGPATCPAGSSDNGTWQPDAVGGWWPPQEQYHCQYAARFVSVLAAYDLGVPEADRKALETTLRGCADADGTGISARSVSQALRQPPIITALAGGIALVAGGLTLRRRQKQWARAMHRQSHTPQWGGEDRDHER